MESDRIRLVPAPAPAPAPSPGPAPQRARQDSGSGPAPGPGPQVRQEPLFHSVPPRPQRLLHSEAYIKYIEVIYPTMINYTLNSLHQGLNKDSRSMCNWDKQLNASQEVTD